MVVTAAEFKANFGKYLELPMKISLLLVMEKRLLKL